MWEDMPVLTDETVAKIPARLASVPPFPRVAMKLMSLLADEASNVSTIAACIGTDPVLAGRLIKRANAADQASYCETRNVLQAVMILGVNRTREIALAAATAAYAHAAIKTEVLRPCWRHTLACALAASEVARQCGLAPAESYTAALLHDIGRVGLVAAYPDEYEAMMAGAEGTPFDLMEQEREHFGVDHVEAGVWLARQWKLPDSILDVIARHHGAPSGAMDQVRVVQVACRLADLLGFSVNRPVQPLEFEEIAAMLPAWVRPRLEGRLGYLQEAIAKEIRLSEGAAGGASRDVFPEDPEIPGGGPHSVPVLISALPYSHGTVIAATLAMMMMLLAMMALVVRR